jgi:glutathione S-transferase
VSVLANDTTRSQIDAWVDWSIALTSKDLTASWVHAIFGATPYDKEAAEAGPEKLLQLLIPLEAHLQQRTFLVGHTVTLADLVVACEVLLFYVSVRLPHASDLACPAVPASAAAQPHTGAPAS